MLDGRTDAEEATDAGAGCDKVAALRKVRDNPGRLWLDRSALQPLLGHDHGHGSAHPSNPTQPNATFVSVACGCGDAMPWRFAVGTASSQRWGHLYLCLTIATVINLLHVLTTCWV